MPIESRPQRAVRLAAAVVFLAAGVAHFAAPAPLVRMIPPYLPAPLALVLLSGLAEMAGGAGLLIPRFRRTAGWGLSAMLVSFLPANLFMALHPAEAGFAAVPTVVFWSRILLLPVLIWGLLWASGGYRCQGRLQ
jgi:uncharacterized membrane protein